MGSMTITEMVAQARGDLSLFPTSTAVLSSQDYIDRQMVSLANTLGRELQTQFSWHALQTEFIINTRVILQAYGDTVEGSPVITNITNLTDVEAWSWMVLGSNIPVSARIQSVDSATQVTMEERATGTQVQTLLTFSKDTYTIPTDFQSFIGDTWWDRTNRWSLRGPTSPQFDQFLRSGIVTNAPRRNWRQIGRTAVSYRLWPPPGTTDPSLTLVFEYNSLNWVNTGTSTASRFTLSDDTTIYPDDVFVMGLKVKFMQAKGMDVVNSSLMADYRNALERAKAADAGAGKLRMSSPQPYDGLLDWWNVPSNSFPGRAT